MIKSRMRATIEENIDDVWNAVTDINNYSWRSDINKVTAIDDKKFKEHTRDGFVTEFCITNCIPLERWEFDLENENMNGHWVGLFFKKGNKTKIDFFEEVQKKKPIFNLLIKIYLKKRQKIFLNDLKSFLNKKQKKASI